MKLLQYDDVLTFKLLTHFVDRWQQIKLSFARCRHDTDEEVRVELFPAIVKRVASAMTAGKHFEILSRGLCTSEQTG